MKLNSASMRGFCNLVLVALRNDKVGNEYELRSTGNTTSLIEIDLDGYEKTILKVEMT